jgi:phytoene/squalene synthetase
MLVDLVRHARSPRCELESYLTNMMRVMAFDADRRGRLVAGDDLDAYTSWLAKAVTDAVSHFVGGGHAALDGDRYRAAAGAHILHMLRDTYEDVRVGYYNIPRERLEAYGIGPEDIGSAAYRAWVSERVRLARSEFAAGRAYIARCDGQRYRLAGLAYIGRFEWLIERLERDGFRLQPHYDEPSSVATALRMGGRTAQRMLVRSGQGQ